MEPLFTRLLNRAKNRIRSLRGFSLVELMVVLAIIVVITTVTMVAHTNFNKTLLLTNTAYTVALSAREAQSYGLSSRRFSTSYNAGYGLYFTGSSSTYKLFSDILGTAAKPAWCLTGTTGTPDAKPGNCRYDSSTEDAKTYTLNRGYLITDVCGTDTGLTKRCTSTGYFSSVAIVFMRPNTDTIITGVTPTGTAVKLSCATIRIRAPGSTNEKCVLVSTVGQISVPLACPAASLQTCP